MWRYGGTHSVHMIYWEGVGVYGGGGGGPIVVLWRRNKFLRWTVVSWKMGVTEHCIFDGEGMR